MTSNIDSSPVDAGRLAIAEGFLRSLGAATNELAGGKPCNRTTAAGACFAIAQDHADGIIVLLGRGVIASAFALARVTFEAYVRGLWLRYRATDALVDRFLGDGDAIRPSQITLTKLVDELAQDERFRDGRLSAITDELWDALCDYTHTGTRHIARRIMPASIEPCYPLAEVTEVIEWTEFIAAHAVTEIAHLVGDFALVDRVRCEYEALPRAAQISTGEPSKETEIART